MEFISILEASALSGKSIQTIRRMIKAKKVRVRKQKTPQGFVYLIDKLSLNQSLVSQTPPAYQPLPAGQMPSIQSPRQHGNLNTQAQTDWQKEIERFNTTIQKLIDQNERDKENFFGLVKNFQDRIFVLENQIKLLEAPKQKWWRLW